MAERGSGAKKIVEQNPNLGQIKQQLGRLAFVRHMPRAFAMTDTVREPIIQPNFVLFAGHVLRQLRRKP